MRKIKPSSSILWLTGFIILLAIIATWAGLFLPGGAGPISFTTLQGQTVEIFGQGLYHRDTVFVGAGSRGADAVTLGIGIPLLAICGLLHWRGSLRGTLLLLGTFVYFLYIYASYALGGVVYNRLLLVYIALFSASLYAVVLTFRWIERHHLAALTSPRLPRLGPAIFMIASGCVTLFIWLTPLLPALMQDQPPATLGSYYTGRVTDALDLGLITPSTFLTGWLILRRSPLGYLLALALLVLEIMLLPMITAQTISQLAAGIAFTPAEIIGPIAGFVTLGLLGVWVTISILRAITRLTDQSTQ